MDRKSLLILSNKKTIKILYLIFIIHQIFRYQRIEFI
jgi:hypothetical protein